jgi:hypothetical protein
MKYHLMMSGSQKKRILSFQRRTNGLMFLIGLLEAEKKMRILYKVKEKKRRKTK